MSEAKLTAREKIGEIVDAIRSTKHVRAIAETQELLLYEDGVYRRGTEWKIARQVETLEPNATNHLVNEVLGKLRRLSSVPLDEFDRNPSILNVANCLIDIRTKKVMPHSPGFLSLNQITVRHDPLARARPFENFMERILPNLDDRLRFLDLFASCLWTVGIKKSVMLVGDTDSGKSTLLEIVRRFIGEDNVSSVSLQDLEKDRFAAADLFGKRANIHADIDREGLKRSTYFKTATGKRDKIRAQRKYGQPFSFVPYAKHFYSANRIPVTEDESDAFFNRWMIVFFGQLFIERDAKDGYMVDGRLPENIHVKDERIVEKLTTPEMLSGILNILLDRARLVAAVGNIPNAPSIEQTRNAWLSNSDFTKRFLDQTVTFDGENRVPREELYQRYARWSLHIKITPDSQTEFNKKVRRIGAIDLDAKPSGRRGMTIKSWKGIRYKGESSEKPVETVEHRQPVRSTSSTALDRNPSMQLSDEALSACRDMMASINGELVTCELCEKMYLPEVLLHHQELVHGR